MSSAFQRLLGWVRKDEWKETPGSGGSGSRRGRRAERGRLRHPFGRGQVPWISEVVRLPSSRKVSTQHHV